MKSSWILIAVFCMPVSCSAQSSPTLGERLPKGATPALSLKGEKIAFNGNLLSLGRSMELTIPNFDSQSPACQVKLPETPGQCGVEGCVLPAPKHSTLGSIRLNFSCLPKSAPTGFENPAEYVKVQSVHGKNAAGHLSLIDDIQPPPAERTRELSFCLYGKENNFCGAATALRLKDGPKADATAAIKSFIHGIELQGALDELMN